MVLLRGLQAKIYLGSAGMCYADVTRGQAIQGAEKTARNSVWPQRLHTIAMTLMSMIPSNDVYSSRC